MRAPQEPWRVEDLLAPLAPLHRQALQWYFERSGEIHRWPAKATFTAGTTFLASTPKGIYKPAWTHYALSVRQSLDGPYDDHIVPRSDGTWSFSYFQEGFDPGDVHAKATNRGLMACWADHVPVGVFRQVSRKPGRYEILGVALVATFDGGFFFLEGASATGAVRAPGSATELELLAQARTEAVAAAHSRASDVVAPLLARQRVFREILQRRGQAAFREQLLHAYRGRCAVSSYDAADALEAAHIVPYADAGVSTPRNGLLLRADVHTLCDLGLLSVDPAALRVRLSERLASTRYEPLHDRPVHVPVEASLRPDPDFLAKHAQWAGAL